MRDWTVEMVDPIVYRDTLGAWRTQYSVLSTYSLLFDLRKVMVSTLLSSDCSLITDELIILHYPT